MQQVNLQIIQDVLRFFLSAFICVNQRPDCFVPTAIAATLTATPDPFADRSLHRAREAPFFQQSLAEKDHLWIIDKKNLDCDFPNHSSSLDLCSHPGEVISPNILPRIEKPDYLASVIVDACDVRSFVAIAVQTG